MSKWSGICVCSDVFDGKCALNFSEFDDDIVGPEPESKALYWLEQTISEYCPKIEKEIYDTITSWMHAHSSSSISFLIKGCGELRIVKKYSS